MILCWATFPAMLGCMWPTGRRLDTPAVCDIFFLALLSICNGSMAESTTGPLIHRGKFQDPPVDAWKAQIIPNTNHLLQLCLKCGSSVFTGRHSFCSRFRTFPFSPVPGSVEPIPYFQWMAWSLISRDPLLKSSSYKLDAFWDMFL